MQNEQSISKIYEQAAETIKAAILQSQYKASRQSNGVLLSLYFSVGRYISQNSRNGYWGMGALKAISDKLQRDLPGLRGFSEGHLKKMRIFAEEWGNMIDKSFIAMHDLEKSSSGGELNVVEIRSSQCTISEKLSADDFMQVPFTHHYTILSKVKDYEERCFYIMLCANEHLSVEALKKALAADEYHHKGGMPNNFFQRLSPTEQARRAVMAFKDEYLLDFINVEEIGTRDREDIDEKVVENAIVNNIRNFIMTFGRDFAFLGNQYRIEAMGHTHFIDLLFYNRELACLVAVELKRGEIKSAYLGQLNQYLALLDDYVRKPNENPSIGIVLCKEMDKTYAEYMVRQYDKPMGVATYKTSADMPERLRKALPDIEKLRMILEKEG